MLNCPKCESDKIRKQGKRTLVTGEVRQCFSCYACKYRFTPDPRTPFQQFIVNKKKFAAENTLTDQRYVITSAQNNSKINTKFFKALIHYCEINHARLIVIPCKYVLDTMNLKWDAILLKYMVTENVMLSKKLRLLAGINLLPTLENPLNGLDSLSKGDSLVIGHQQLQMRSLAVNMTDSATIITTTGSITHPNSSSTKAGLKSDFNHSFSAIVIEREKDVFHYRTLNSDSTGGFFDIAGYYSSDTFKPGAKVDAVVLGDTHAIFIDPQVKANTFTDKYSIVNTLKPKLIFHGDLLDCFSISHHHNKNFLARYGKHLSGMNNLETELHNSLKLLKDTTPEFSKLIMVASNHNDHLYQWLNNADPKSDPVNAKLYHYLMYLMMDSAKVKGGLTHYDNPFEIWIKLNGGDLNVEFLPRDTSYKLHGIEMSLHGDIGSSGMRGSPASFAKLAHKNIVGHSHSACIEKGNYTVGTSSRLKLEYNHGLSKWTHTHCIVYANGKRQLINIVDGGWNSSPLLKKGKA